MRASLLPSLGLLILLIPTFSTAQLTIQNPKNLDIPEQRADVIYRVVWDVVAREFTVERTHVDFPVILVLGDKDQRYTADDEHRIYKIYLREWNEPFFTSSAMMLAIHGVVSREREQRMLLRILQRTNRIAPVDSTSLRRTR